MREVNDFVGTLEEGKLIDVKYNTVPPSVSTHT
ncbi:sporulation protein Cse60 [Bacillus sp. MUM 116]|nr:sporulation protein Cse60 [Bacillus sp. MUM 116]